MERSDAPTAAAAPRLAAAWAAAVYALFALLLGYPALGGRFLVNPHSDQYIAGYAFREFGADFLSRTGSFPLWNPYLFGGMPFVAGMHGDIFYPTFLLRLALPTDAAMTWGFILHLVLAGLFTYLLLRALGLGFAPALLGGTSYQLSGAVASLVSPGHDGKLYVSSLLPLVLLLIYRGVRQGRTWSWGALALAVGLAVLSPHPQMLQYVLLTAGAWAVYLALGGEGEAIPRPVMLRRLGLALGAVLLGALIGAIQYLPVREYVAWSPRAGGRGYDHATSFSMLRPELLNTFVPEFTGILENYWGANGIHLHSEYLGAAAFVLAFAGMGTMLRRRGSRLFWIGVLVVGFLWTLGGSTPFYRIVYALVPGTKFFRAPGMAVFVPSFAFAVLAAFGAERILGRRVTTRYLVGWLVGAGAVAVLATTGALSNLAASVAGPERYDFVQANAGNLLLGAWRSFAAVAALVAVALVWLRRPTIGAPLAAALMIAVVAADLWSVERRYWRFSAPASDLFASDPIIAYLRARSDSARVLGLALSELEAPRDPYIGAPYGADGFMVHRIRQVAGYHGNELGRYQALYGKDEWPRQIGNPNFWQLANLQFFYTNVDQPPVPGMTKVLGPVTNSAGSTVYLYRFPGDQPAAWVAGAIVKARDEQVLATLLEPRFNVKSVALFDTSSAVPGRSDLTVAPDTLPIRARVVRPWPDEIRIALDAPAPAGSALVMTENFYPGWTATVDGRPATAERADYSLIGVALPAGAREVRLRFRSAVFETGRTLTVLALAASTLLLVGGAVLDRRRRV